VSLFTERHWVESQLALLLFHLVIFLLSEFGLFSLYKFLLTLQETLRDAALAQVGSTLRFFVDPWSKGQLGLLSFFFLLELPLDSLLALLLEVLVVRCPLMNRPFAVLSKLGGCSIDTRCVLSRGQLTQHTFHAQLLHFHLLPASVVEKSIHCLVELHLGMMGQSLRTHKPLQHGVIELIMHLLLGGLVHQ